MKIKEKKNSKNFKSEVLANDFQKNYGVFR